MEWLASPEVWMALITLTALEIVLGVDNIIFIAILVGRLPLAQQARARTIGLGLAMLTRLALLFSITLIMRLTHPFVTLFEHGISGRDLILIGGGLFLLAKSTMEIHESLEGEELEEHSAHKKYASFLAIIIQIAILDIVFSLDSVITAVGLSDQLAIMATAIIIAVGVMLFLAGPISDFVDKHPTVKVLALSFLIMVGMALVGEGFTFHIPKGYIYFAMAFSVFVEMLNMRLRAKRIEPLHLRKSIPMDPGRRVTAMHVHTIIVGAGPGGLACARMLAVHGIQTLVIERQESVGAKVCAGGITWGGLISRVPRSLAEKSFPVQHIATRLQRARIEEPRPIIATVNRVKLGTYMTDQALTAGAEIMTGWQVKGIKGQTLLIEQKKSRKQQEVSFDYLVGADGSNSLVRRHLGLASNKMGVGINFHVCGDRQKMEWHLNSQFFRNGYGWIFPHSNTVSVGAYVPQGVMSAQQLKKGLIAWAGTLGFSLEKEQARADYINYDYQGWRFGRSFLIGDAAGLASGLTGEGIYPAIISGEETARTIIDPEHSTGAMEVLTRKHRLHSRMAAWTGASPIFNIIAGELVTLGLRCGLIKFSKLEMA